MAKFKGGKRLKIKKEVLFNFGNIILMIFSAILIFLIGRAIGKRERFSPIMINQYTKSGKSPYNDENVRQRLHMLSQI